MKRNNYKVILLVSMLLLNSLSMSFASSLDVMADVNGLKKGDDYKLLDGNGDSDLFNVSPTDTLVPGETKLIKDLPNGSIVYDSTWKWEHRVGNGYTDVGETKSIEWLVVSKNHIGYPDNSVTLLSKDLISKYFFDNSINRGSDKGANHYGNSGTPNATAGIRPFLNTSLYNTFSSKFKSILLETTLNMRALDGGSYTLKDKVFLPSVNEVGGVSTTSDGTNWGYFTDDLSRVSNINKVNTGYWTRTPYSVISSDVYGVSSTGVLGFNYNAFISTNGVRPVVNIKSNVLVKSVGGNKWEIVHTQDDTTAPKLDLVLSNTKPTKEDVTITATANEVTIPNSIVSGVKRIQTPDGIWKDGSTVSYTVNSNGSYIFKVEDNSGNVGTATMVVSNVNKTKPNSPTITLSTTELTSKDVTATIIYTEDSVVRMYRLGSSEWRIYTGPVVVSSNTTVYAKGINNVEVSSEDSSLVISNIDKTKPNQPTIVVSTTTPTNKDVTITINSNAVNLGRVEYRIDSGNWITYTVPFLVNRNCTIEARNISTVGNISSTGIMYVSNISKAKPVITIEEYDDEPTSSSVTITATVDNGTLNVSSHTFTKNGYFTFTAKNEYGNISERTVRIDHIDESLPTKGEILVIALDEDKKEIEVKEMKDLKLGKHTIKAPVIEGYKLKGAKSTTVELKPSKNEVEVKFSYLLDNEFEEVRKSLKLLEDRVKESEKNKTLASKDKAQLQLDKTFKLLDKITKGKIKDELTKQFNELKDRLDKVTIVEVPVIEAITIKVPEVTSTNFLSRYKGHIAVSKEPINIINKEIVSISITKEQMTDLTNNKLVPRMYRWDNDKNRWVYLSTKANGNNLSTYQPTKGHISVFGIQQPKFIDIKESDWFYRFIDRASGLSLLEGSLNKEGNIVANPNSAISRGELYTTVARIFGAVPKGQSTLYNEFNSIVEESGQNWYKPFVKEYVSKGIIDKMFTDKEAKEDIKRKEVVLLLTEMIELVEKVEYINLDSYKDTKGLNIKIANILEGYEDNTLRLDNKITRAEAMTLIINTLEGLGW